MIRLDNVPYGRAAIETLYGNPSTEDFYDTKLVRVDVPFALRLSWNPRTIVSKVKIHSLVAESFLDALRDVLEQVGEDKLDEMKWNYFGGTYAHRQKTGSRELSTHAWGIAVDLNPHLGPFGKQCPEYPKVFVKVFEDRGWIWGGRWRTPDGMHFQAGRGY